MSRGPPRWSVDQPDVGRIAQEQAKGLCLMMTAGLNRTNTRQTNQAAGSQRGDSPPTTGGLNLSRKNYRAILQNELRIRGLRDILDQSGVNLDQDPIAALIP